MLHGSMFLSKLDILNLMTACNSSYRSTYVLLVQSMLSSLMFHVLFLGSSECDWPGIVTALTWPASLLAVASVIDNPWGVCLSRSAEVGKHLAQVLRSRQQVRRSTQTGPRERAPYQTALSCSYVWCVSVQGKRPVSLIGFSLGARVIYFCLQELANDKGMDRYICKFTPVMKINFSSNQNGRGMWNTFTPQQPGLNRW